MPPPLSGVDYFPTVPTYYLNRPCLLQPTAAVNYPQENPPWEAHELEVEMPPRPFPDPEATEANVDKTFSLSSEPHEGQGPLSSPLLLKQRDSKTVPHFLHLNSKIGIYSSLIRRRRGQKFLTQRHKATKKSIYTVDTEVEKWLRNHFRTSITLSIKDRSSHRELQIKVGIGELRD